MTYPEFERPSENTALAATIFYSGGTEHWGAEASRELHHQSEAELDGTQSPVLLRFSYSFQDIDFLT